MQRRTLISDRTQHQVLETSTGTASALKVIRQPLLTSLVPLRRSPLRTNLRLPSTHGVPIVLRGNIFKEDGKTPIANALVEIWHCDENEVYDNISDDYKYRGGQRTKADGKYSFKSILRFP
ncbi:MAG: hypothetical protein IPP73_16465 [Chitinophagaceae bacterium]|nr:hypothetical protein [Chitinophagaceae bacterium]